MAASDYEIAGDQAKNEGERLEEETEDEPTAEEQQRALGSEKCRVRERDFQSDRKHNCKEAIEKTSCKRGRH